MQAGESSPRNARKSCVSTIISHHGYHVNGDIDLGRLRATDEAAHGHGLDWRGLFGFATVDRIPWRWQQVENAGVMGATPSSAVAGSMPPRKTQKRSWLGCWCCRIEWAFSRAIDLLRVAQKSLFVRNKRAEALRHILLQPWSLADYSKLALEVLPRLCVFPGVTNGA